MSQMDKGVLMFKEWVDAMSELSPKEFKMLFLAICRYQSLGEEPPEFKGKAKIIASMIFPYISRRIAQSNGAKRAISARRERLSENPIINDILLENERKKAER